MEQVYCSPHMAGNGDTKFVPELDDFYVNVPLNYDYWFYDDPFNDVFVGTNGYVTRNTGVATFVPHLMSDVTYWPAGMIAPLFGDNYLNSDPPNNNIWYRETQNPEMLTKAQEAIQTYFDSCGGPAFIPQSLFIVTWQRVKSFCWVWNYWSYGCDREISQMDEMREFPDQPDKPPVDEGKRRMMAQMREFPDEPEKPAVEDLNKRMMEQAGREFPDEPEKPAVDDLNKRMMEQEGRDEPPINGYQLVLATDGDMTFAIFNMHTIAWACCWDYNTSGFSAGDNWRSCDLPGSGTPTIDQLTSSSNVGKEGRWIYRVDPCQVYDPQCDICN